VVNIDKFIIDYRWNTSIKDINSRRSQNFIYRSISSWNDYFTI